MTKIKFKVPTKLDLEGLKLDIEYAPKIIEDGEELDGCYKSGKIIISLENATSRDNLFSTLMHEVYHAVLFKTGKTAMLYEILPSLEEGIVCALENYLGATTHIKATSWVSSKFIELEVEDVVDS